LFAHQDVTESVGESQGAKRTDGVDEEGVGPVEGMDESGAVSEAGPTRCLNRSAYLEGQLIEVPLGGGGIDPAFVGESEQCSVGGDVVEAVVVDPNVRNVGRHALDRPATAHLQESAIPRGIKLEKRRAVLEALGPFGPAAGRVTALDGEHRSSLGGTPGFLEVQNLFGGQLEDPFEGRGETSGGQARIDVEGHAQG
jgi:hypothetical protein